MKRVDLILTGRTPFLMHNVRLANPLDAYAKKLGELNRSKKVKGADKDEIAAAMARIEWQGGLYHGETDPKPDDIGPYLPARNIHQAIHEGAKMTKEGGAVREGSFPVDMRFPLLYDGPRTVNELWDAGYADSQAVVVGMSKVTRTRPIFRVWSVQISFEVDPDACDPDRFRDYAVAAGRYKGVGDGHKGIFGMGRFEVS